MFEYEMTAYGKTEYTACPYGARPPIEHRTINAVDRADAYAQANMLFHHPKRWVINVIERENTQAPD